MSLADLRGAVLAVEGIAAAEVESRSDRGPTVRVWLDGSRAPDLVSADLRRVLERAGLHAAPPDHSVGSPPAAGIDADPTAEPAGANGSAARRTGLGRGLDALIPAPDPELSPGPNQLETIAVEESSSGTAVRAVDRTGRFAVVPIDRERSLNQAVAAAVAELSTVEGVPTVLAVEVRRVAGSSVLVTVVEHEGRRASGSAIVDSGMTFALGRAIWAALRSLS